MRHVKSIEAGLVVTGTRGAGFFWGLSSALQQSASRGVQGGPC